MVEVLVGQDLVRLRVELAQDLRERKVNVAVLHPLDALFGLLVHLLEVDEVDDGAGVGVVFEHKVVVVQRKVDDVDRRVDVFEVELLLQDDPVRAPRLADPVDHFGVKGNKVY